MCELLCKVWRRWYSCEKKKEEAPAPPTPNYGIKDTPYKIQKQVRTVVVKLTDGSERSYTLKSFIGNNAYDAYGVNDGCRVNTFRSYEPNLQKTVWAANYPPSLDMGYPPSIRGDSFDYVDDGESSHSITASCIVEIITGPVVMLDEYFEGTYPVLVKL